MMLIWSVLWFGPALAWSGSGLVRLSWVLGLTLIWTAHLLKTTQLFSLRNFTTFWPDGWTFFPTYAFQFISIITIINSSYWVLVWPSIWPKWMDFGHAGFWSFWEVIGFYGPQAGAHRGPLGTDAIQSGLARNHRNPFRLYCRLGLCHMVPQHAQLCCTSPCVAARKIHLWFHTCHLCFLGVCLRPPAELFPIRKVCWIRTKF